VKNMTPEEADAIMSSTLEKPVIHAYLRSSKLAGSNSNVIAQQKNLAKLLSSFYGNREYTLNGDFFYEVETYADIALSGTHINPALKKLIDSLGYFDVILLSDVSRATRLDLTTTEFTILLEELFACRREVWVLRHGKIIKINEADFIKYSKISLSEYERLGISSVAGNEVNSRIKRQKKNIAIVLYNDGHELQVIANTVGVTERTVSTYVKEGRAENIITREPYKRVIAKRTRPVM
jgi:hypothetical protein